MHAARLIPVSGISSEKEAETRATSAVLAVLTVVRDLSIEIFSPLGASRAQKATVEAFTEVNYNVGKRKIRPDGLVRITYGKNAWTCLVEVKTGEAQHTAEQINEYWDLARSEKVDHVLTISNEIAPNAHEHPTGGLKVRSNSKVQVSHLSWTGLLTTAVRLKQHAGVSDPEWILGELIRYLEHPASGALAFADMGPNWVPVRDGAKVHTLDKRTEGLDDVVVRWDQLLRYAALKLGSEIGEDVVHWLPKAMQNNKARSQHLVGSLVSAGELDGTLRIPNTVSDIALTADLRGQQLVAAVDVQAPEDRGARARVTWLLKQLKDAPDELVIESYRRNARQCTAATLGVLREDKQQALGDDTREPSRFRLVLRVPMGQGRRTGKRNPGFIDSVLIAIDRFYGEVVQNLSAWQPPAPRIKRPSPRPAEAAISGQSGVGDGGYSAHTRIARVPLSGRLQRQCRRRPGQTLMREASRVSKGRAKDPWHCRVAQVGVRPDGASCRGAETKHKGLESYKVVIRLRECSSTRRGNSCRRSGRARICSSVILTPFG